ncbi:MAG: hypothetical protein HQL52_12615 [Magnetococcales bacterium]|nr:hypothetical protein [Magnetococcales bacterium]
MIVTPVQAAEISTSEVYFQAQRIVREIKLLHEHFHIPVQLTRPEPFKAALHPRQVWQKSYFILVKLNVFRAKNALPAIPPSAMEPVLHLDPALVYEQTQRVLTEIAIIKKRLDIEGSIEEPTLVIGKRPIDAFNKLHEASLAMEVLNEEVISPSHVFAEVMRIFEDVSTVLARLNLEDTSFPPAKLAAVKPKKSLIATFDLMQEIQRLQRDLGIPRTDFSAFHKKSGVAPDDVFNMVGMSLAELQTIKASLELTRTITPPARIHEAKTPAEVHQLLQWIIRKLRLIQQLR